MLRTELGSGYLAQSGGTEGLVEEEMPKINLERWTKDGSLLVAWKEESIPCGGKHGQRNWGTTLQVLCKYDWGSDESSKPTGP